MGILLAACLLCWQTPPAHPRFVVDRWSGEAVTGSVTELDPTKGVSLLDQPAPFPWPDLLRLQQTGQARPALPRGPVIQLANGDQIAAEIVSATDTTLRTRLLGQPKETPVFEIPLSAISAIWWGTIPAPIYLEASLEAGDEKKKRGDLVLLRNGDRLNGSLESLSGEPVQLRLKTGAMEPVRLEANQIQAILFEPGLARVRTPKTAYVRLLHRNGSRISLRLPTGKADRLQATTLFGTPLECPWKDVIALDVLQGSGLSLADWKAEVKADPFNELAWPMQRNRSVQQRPLQLHTANGWETFERGLGVRAGTELRYRLAQNKYARGRGLVGLAAETGFARCTVRILIDGKQQALPGQGELGPGQQSIAVDLELETAQELVFEVLPSKSGVRQADVNLIDWQLKPIKP